MKSLKPILICGAVILAVVLALVIFKVVAPAETPEEPASNSAESPSIIPEEQSISIVHMNHEDLKTVEFLPAEGDSFSVDIELDAEGNYAYTVTPAAEHFEYSPSMLRSMMFTVSSITAKNEIDANGDLATYGLDHPWQTVRSTYQDGTVVELYLGNRTLVDQNFYCSTNLSDKVYVIGNYTATLLARSELAYRESTLFYTYEGDAIYDSINWVRMTLRDGTAIEIEHDAEHAAEINNIGSDYIMRSPYVGSASDELVMTNILDVVAPIKKIDILCDITEDEFAEYGFDKPARLEMTDLYNNSLNLLIGKACENDLYTYAMIDGTYTVLTIESSCLSWLTVKPVELFVRLGWIYTISDVESVAFQFNTDAFRSMYDELEESYLIEMTHGKTTNDKGESISTVDATINGEPLSEANCRRLYVRMLNMRVIDFLPENADLSAEPDAVFTVNLLDGKTSTMELIPINDRDYAMVIDGNAQFFIYQKNLNNLITGLKENAMGYELTSEFAAY